MVDTYPDPDLDFGSQWDNEHRKKVVNGVDKQRQAGKYLTTTAEEKVPVNPPASKEQMDRTGSEAAPMPKPKSTPNPDQIPGPSGLIHGYQSHFSESEEGAGPSSRESFARKFGKRLLGQ